MKKIIIIGAGQIGSRHLQALAKVKQPLDISVIDPSEDSLALAKERFESISSGRHHTLHYANVIPSGRQNFDVAIIATNSNKRREAIESFLASAKVRYCILEKLLFQKKSDFKVIGKLFKKTGTKAWVNCMMRGTPFYYAVKKEIKDKRIFYYVNRTDTGLATSTIHFIDHVAFLTGCLDYIVDTSAVDKKPIASKRKGFFDLTGTVRIEFKNGSTLIFSCYATGEAPPEVIIDSPDVRYIVREAEEKAWVSLKKENWISKEVVASIPLQSSMTTGLVEELLSKGTCPLVSYADAVKLHLPILDAYLAVFNRSSGKKIDYYPFT